MSDAGTRDADASIDDASIAFDDDRRLGTTTTATRTDATTTRTVEGTVTVGTTVGTTTTMESRGDAPTDDEDDANVTLEMYLSGDVVLARGGGKEPMWPGVVVDPRDAPEGARRACRPESVCVMFFGPSGTRGRERDYCWATLDGLRRYRGNAWAERYFAGARAGAKKSRVAAFRDALEEAREVVTANGGDPRLGVDAFGGVGGEKDGEDGEDGGRGGLGMNSFGLPCVVAASETPRCTSCGVVGDEGLKLKTARGRCRLCQKLHKDGQFCPVCDRVWHWSAGDPMVGCDRCDKWIHRECDARAAEVLDREEKDGEELAYECPLCRNKSPEQLAEEARLAEVARAEEERKAQIRERKRLEKLVSKPRVGRPSKAVIEAREALKRMPKMSKLSRMPSRSPIKSPHAVSKKQNTVPKRPKSSWQLFSADFFQNLKDERGDENIDFAEIYRAQGAAWRDLEPSERQKYEDMAKDEADRFKEMIFDMFRNGELDETQQKRYDKILHPEQYETKRVEKASRNPDANKASRRSKAGDISKLPDGSAMPETLAVICNGVAADYYTRSNQVLCQCSDCAGEAKFMSPTEFEKHAGMGQAKKWKSSLRMVEPAKMPIGRFLDGSDFDKRPRLEDGDDQKSKELDYEIVKVNWSVDRCAVCDDERDFDYDQLITCEACAITVHQSCYGVPDIPDDTVGWLCRSCEHTGGAVSETPLCCLCPVAGGALKPTTIPSLWAHSACCQWIPETTVLDIERMEPIDNIGNIQKERWTLLCTVCKQRMGAKIQCCHPGCYLAYHPLCARAAGLYMDANEDGEDEEAPLQLLSYCHRHCRVDTERAQIYSGDKGMRIGEDDRLIQCGANKERKATKAERRAEEEKRELEEAQACAEESELSSDSEYDLMSCAKFRPYVPIGHPRTEADIKDDNDDDFNVPGSAAKKKPKLRKRVLHTDEEDDKDDEDDEDDEDEDAERTDTDTIENSITEASGSKDQTARDVEMSDDMSDEDEDMEELSDLDVEYDAAPTDDDTDAEVEKDESEIALPSSKISEDRHASPAAKKRKMGEADAVDSPDDTARELPGQPIASNPKHAAVPGDPPVPKGNVPRPELPEVKVRCNKLTGIFRPADTYIRCLCRRCEREAEIEQRASLALWEANKWEAHAGMKHTKKWKISIKIVADGANEGEEETFGDWLERNKVVVLANMGKSARAIGLPGKKPKKDQDGSRVRKTKALLGLGLGQFEHDKLGGMEAKARALVGRRIQVDVGTIVAPEWKDGTIIDVNITRTGIRYKLFFDDGTDQLLSFTRDALNLKFTDGDAPDLSFLPAGEKLSKSKNTQLEMKIAIANAKFKSAKRPSNPADRARIADLARPKKPREKEAWVQCENPQCGKWRRVPQSFAEKLSADDADMWTCEKNPERAFAICSVPQEFEDDEIDRRIALGDDAPYMEDSDDEASDSTGYRTHVPDDLPAMVSVVCRGIPGTYHVQTRRIECLCQECVAADDGPVYIDREKFEAHTGVKGTKKWRSANKVVLSNGTLITLGKWLEIWGCEVYREEMVDLTDPSLAHTRKLSRKQLEEIQRNVYKRLGLNKNDKNAKVTGPPPKTGKRLIVGLTPYIVRGTRGGFIRELIESKKYTPEEFAAVQNERKSRGQGANADDGKIVEQQGMTMREKLEHMTATYSDRLTFAKSNIHGWGLVAKVFHKAGSIVTQFKGETCRSTVADIRESRYEEDGVDCYLLKQDDDTVVDCTFQGNYARFTNHSCNPNMYSKIVKVDNENHIIFFARTDIKAGEELTYNYRFESEDGKVPCYCGAQNCRGYLC